MKKSFFLLAASLVMGYSFSACSDDDADTTKPEIQLHEPENGDSLLIGANVHFEADFSDNEALGSYLVEIHNNFDGHGHSASTRADEPFSFKKSYDLGGLRNSHVHHHDIVIPENATLGAYHLVVYCTDAAGNQSLVARDIVLSHDAAEHEHEHEHEHDHED